MSFSRFNFFSVSSSYRYFSLFLVPVLDGALPKPSVGVFNVLFIFFAFVCI